MTLHEIKALSDLTLWARIEAFTGKKALLYSRDGVFKALEEPIPHGHAWRMYVNRLCCVVGEDESSRDVICATSRQRCEAWLLWRMGHVQMP